MDDQLSQEYLEAYRELREVLASETGYDAYLIGGSLLGPVRDGQLLKNDKDMDVAYLSQHTDAESVRRELFALIMRLASRYPNIEMVRESWSAVRTHFRWRKNNRVRIDVMPAWFSEHDNQLYYCRPTFVAVKAEKNLVLPLQHIDFRGTDVLFPAEPEQKLELVYGQGWRQPDPAFDKDSMRSVLAAHEIRKLRLSWGQQFAVIRATKQAEGFSWFDLAWVWIASNLWVKGFRRILLSIRAPLSHTEHLA